jgi:hypothetical protein
MLFGGPTKPLKGSFRRTFFASVIPSVMRKKDDGSVFPSMIESPPNCFSRAIAIACLAGKFAQSRTGKRMWQWK